MQPTIGDIVRFEYQHPAGLPASQRPRAMDCLCVGNGDHGFHVSPITTVPPRPDERAFAVPLPSGLRSKLGYGSKPAWLRADLMNYAENGTSALRAVQKPGSMPSWQLGSVNRDFLTEVWQARRAAGARKSLTIQTPAAEVLARPAPVRSMPGQSRDMTQRTTSLRQIAANILSQRKMEAQAAQATAEPKPRAQTTIDISA